MSTSNNLYHGKPVIPPKPKFLSKSSLPKPPNQIISESVSDYESCQFIFTEINSTKKEESSSSETNLEKDVRQRPLPLLPGVAENSIITMPWFEPIDRKRAETIVAKGKDGCFLVRPSSKGEHSFALTLWFNRRAYNIPIRKRSDSNYALGTPKELEQNFSSIEELIGYYQKEELELFSKGVGSGRVKLLRTKSK